MVTWMQYANRRKIIGKEVLGAWFHKRGINTYEKFVQFCHGNEVLLPDDDTRNEICTILDPPRAEIRDHPHAELVSALPTGLAVDSEGYLVPEHSVKKKSISPRRKSTKKSPRRKKSEKK